MNEKIKYFAAMYLRISHNEKGKNSNINSNSIINQKYLIEEFVKEDEEIEIVSVKIDDGYSGTDFNRPGFKKMMEEVYSKKINCIIVKDLSRFGRNYIYVGDYIDRIFPTLNIRLISISDGYDSLIMDANTALKTTFLILIYDFYAQHISQKTKASLRAKRHKGEFLSSFAPYGYKKDPTDKHKIIIDKQAAEVVRKIFRYRLLYYSCSYIAKMLDSQNILIPTEYKLNGFKSVVDLNRKKNWYDHTIGWILRNKVYIGTLEMGKRTMSNYRLKRTLKENIEDKDIVIIENNHEPIISLHDFEKVNKIFGKYSKGNPLNPLSSRILCGTCRKTFKKKGGNNSKYIYYKQCLNCGGKGLKETDIDETLLFVIKNLIYAGFFKE